MIKYLQETRGDQLTLKINDLTTAYWYDDANFAVHADIKSHTRVVLNMGKG